MGDVVLPLIQAFGPWGVVVLLFMWQQAREDKRRDKEAEAKAVEVEKRLEVDKETNQERQLLTTALNGLRYVVQGRVGD